MKQVEISTSNHVAIEYELSSVGQRFTAFILDTIIIVIYLVMISFFAAAFTISISDPNIVLLLNFILALPAVFYSLICEAYFNGQSIGKSIMGIKVARMDGKNPGFGEATIRWTFRLIDIWFSAGSLAFLLITGSEQSQRIGDSLANTIVINKKPKDLYSVEDILSIKDTSDYKPLFPSVVSFTDDDMLLIKNTLDRSSKFPSPKHDELLQALREKVVERLGEDREKASTQKFLKKVLQDYIVLTRS